MTAYATYTPQALHREEFATRNVTALADGKGGDLLPCADGLMAVVAGMKPFVTGDLITLRLVDAYDVPCASGTSFADGAPVFWNTTTKLAVATLAAGNYYLGTARGAKASGATAVRVMLNGAYSILNSTTITFNGSTGANIITVPDNLAQALLVKNADGTAILTFCTTNAAELLTITPAVTITGLLTPNGGLSFLYGTGAAAAANSLLIGGGTSANPCTTSVADKDFVELRCQSTAVSGTGRLAYLRFEIGGAGGSGECLRAFTDLTAAAATCHGAHISLQAGATGYCTGEGIGVRSQLYLKNEAVHAAGTYYGLYAEVWSAGSSSSLAATTKHAILGIAATGDATGMATVMNAISIDGTATAGGGAMISPGTSMGTVAGTIRILINGAVAYLPYYSHEGHA